MWDLEHFKVIVRGYARALNAADENGLLRAINAPAGTPPALYAAASLLAASVAEYLEIDNYRVPDFEGAFVDRQTYHVDELAHAMWGTCRTVREWGTHDVVRDRKTKDGRYKRR